MEANQEKSKKVALYTVLFLAGLLLAGNVFFLNKSTVLKEEKQQALTAVDSLKLTVKHGKEQYHHLLKERDNYLAQNKYLNASIEELRRELSLARENEGKSAGISGLSSKIKALEKQKSDSEIKALSYEKESAKLRGEIEQLKKTNTKLNDEIMLLKRKVEVASELKVTSIDIQCFKVKKEKAKSTEKAKKINKITVSFDVFENLVAEGGIKTVYLLVFNDKGILLDTKAGKFNNKRSGKSESFTAKKEIKFSNVEMTESISFDFTEKLSKGKYRVEIYIDGALSGKRELTLK